MVLLSSLVERFSVSCMRDFFLNQRCSQDIQNYIEECSQLPSVLQVLQVFTDTTVLAVKMANFTARPTVIGDSYYGGLLNCTLQYCTEVYCTLPHCAALYCTVVFGTLV